MPGNSTANGFSADTNDLPESYLDAQGKQFGATFDVLIICNLIFHEDRVLVFKTVNEVKSLANKVGVPIYRLARPSDDNAIGSMLRSRIDHPMSADVTVGEYGRVACRAQVGLDPAKLQNSTAATALHSAVSPAAIQDSIWLRASLLWKVDEAPDLKADNYISKEVLWATQDEVEAIPSEGFLMSVKEDIQTAFELRRRKLSLT